MTFADSSFSLFTLSFLQHLIPCTFGKNNLLYSNMCCAFLCTLIFVHFLDIRVYFYQQFILLFNYFSLHLDDLKISNIQNYRGTNIFSERNIHVQMAMIMCEKSDKIEMGKRRSILLNRAKH